jgi:hypothetical protein
VPGQPADMKKRPAPRWRRPLKGLDWAVESARKVGQRVVSCRPSWGLWPQCEAAGGFRQGMAAAMASTVACARWGNSVV